MGRNGWNQISRRNITKNQRRMIMGRIYNRKKKAHGGEPGGRGNQYVVNRQNDGLPTTAAVVAAEFGVHPATVKRVVQQSAILDAHPEVRQAIIQGTVTRADAVRHAELVADIATNGQRETIKLYRSTVLDGRNRLKACEELGLTPKTATLPDDTDPWSYVWSLNGARRDLVDEQRYIIWADINEHSAAWQAEQQAIKDAANQKRSEAMQGNQNAATKPKTEVGHSVLPLSETKEEPAKESKAKASKTNKGAVARGDKLRKKRPDLAAKVKTGKMKPADAHRQQGHGAPGLAGGTRSALRQGYDRPGAFWRCC